MNFLNQNMQWILFTVNVIASIFLLISFFQKHKSTDDSYKGKLYYFTAYFSGFALLLGTLSLFIDYEPNNWSWGSYILMAILGEILYLKERKI